MKMGQIFDLSYIFSFYQKNLLLFFIGKFRVIGILYGYYVALSRSERSEFYRFLEFSEQIFLQEWTKSLATLLMDLKQSFNKVYPNALFQNIPIQKYFSQLNTSKAKVSEWKVLPRIHIPVKHYLQLSRFTSNAFPTQSNFIPSHKSLYWPSKRLNNPYQVYSNKHKKCPQHKTSSLQKIR